MIEDSSQVLTRPEPTPGRSMGGGNAVEYTCKNTCEEAHLLVKLPAINLLLNIPVKIPVKKLIC